MTLSRQFLILLCASVLLGLGARVVQKHPVAMWGFPKPSEVIQVPEAVADPGTASPDSVFAPADKAYEIKLTTATGLYMKRKKSNIHFIDARDTKLYADGHITGAANIPFEKISQYQSQVDSLPKADLYVLYCDGGDCHLSHDLADLMLQQGFKRLAVFTGGWAEWSKETDESMQVRAAQ
jgi:rhodanese-related sulfurtransferase